MIVMMIMMKDTLAGGGISSHRCIVVILLKGLILWPFFQNLSFLRNSLIIGRSKKMNLNVLILDTK